MRNESPTTHDRDRAFVDASPDSAFLHDVPFDSAPFDAVRSPSSSAATLDDYFDRLSAAFSHTRAAVPSDLLPDSTEDFGKGGTPEGAAPSHEWLAQTGEPQGLQAFEMGEDDSNPILSAVSALMARARSHHDTDDGSRTGEPSAPWHAAVGGAAPAAIPTAFQRPAVNGTHTSSTQHGTSTPAAPSPELVDVVTERVLARLVPELTESLRRLVRQELDRTR